MDKALEYLADAEKWDKGELGADPKYTVKADPALEGALDEALALQMISIRLPKKMIECLKLIALAHGIGYQPLIRDVLSRFVTHEIKQIVRDTNERRKQEAKRFEEECKEFAEKNGKQKVA